MIYDIEIHEYHLHSLWQDLASKFTTYFKLNLLKIVAVSKL